MSTARDIQLAVKAKRHGANYALRIILEARRAGIPISLGFALIEGESGFTNVFGHDRSIYRGAGKVTKEKYRAYKRARGARGQGGMQGVGPGQLTWWETQDLADWRGGCHVPRHNIAVAFDVLAKNIKRYGYALGLERYNGDGPAAVAYSRNLRARADRWHDRLA